MKRSMKLTFLAFISVLTVPGNVFGQTDALENYQTAIGCLQGAIEANNRLVTENEKLMQKI